MYNGAAHPAWLADGTHNSPFQALLLFLLHGSVQGGQLMKIIQKAVLIKDYELCADFCSQFSYG